MEPVGAPAVELIDVWKWFPGVVANHDISLRVEQGTIHAIVGENGAGKSTLMKTLYGMHRPSRGTIKVFGEVQTFASPSAAIAAGIGMVHQHFMLAENFTVLENVILGVEPVRGRLGTIDFDAARQRIRELSAMVGAPLDPDALVGDLGVGARQRIEIIKVLYRGAKIIILDEPTAVLVPHEVTELFVSLKALVAEGATVIFISHKLEEVLEYSDHITVIRAGTTVGDVLPSEVTRKALAQMMVGSDLPDPTTRSSQISDRKVLDLAGISVASSDGRQVVDDVSFFVRSGEIVGIAGVEGNGQQEICEAILGLTPLAAGTVTLDGTDLRGLSTARRKAKGIAYVPFDRHAEALLLSAPLWENVVLGHDSGPLVNTGPMLSAAKSRRRTDGLVDRFDVVTPGVDVPAFALSGGNQQKLVVGREMADSPVLLVAAHPTRGVDIAAQAAIWDELRAARDAGLAVLLISADLEEVIGLSDRILVLFEGRVTGELDPAKVTSEALGEYMTSSEAVA